jgi:asparagine synthetase B (glutamine-hydrolysing)
MDGFSPEHKKPKNGVEKMILRESFKDFLPEDILMRQKNGMSDAVGYSWVDGIKRYAASRFFWNSEERLYKFYYNSFFPEELVSYKWMPKWTDATDPSARYLDNFQDQTTTEADDDKMFSSKKVLITAGMVLFSAALFSVSF